MYEWGGVKLKASEVRNWGKDKGRGKEGSEAVTVLRLHKIERDRKGKEKS